MQPDTGNWADDVRYAGLEKAFPHAVTCDFKAFELGADGSGDRYARTCECDLHRSEQRVHACQHGDVARRGACGDRTAHGVDGDADRVVGARGDGHAVPVGMVRSDGLGDAPMVVPEQGVGRRDHVAGTAVVHVQGMVDGAGEEGGEVDEPAGVGAVVAVDGLVVVAHAEHRSVGAGQQADQQQVGRREVLELVDEQQTTTALRDRPGRRVGQQELE